MAKPEFHVRQWSTSGFRAWGALGWVFGVGAALGGAVLCHSPAAPVVVMAALALGTFVAITVGTGVLTGSISLTFYHHLVAVLAVLSVALDAMHVGVLRYLDLAAVGLMAFLVCGRLGCLSVGCCHGQPRMKGIVYGPEHAQLGFPESLVGVPLAPVQAWEAGAALALTIASLGLLAGDSRPGVTFGFVLGGYSACRFWLEVARGDPGRRRWATFSEAQWTAAATGTAVALAVAAGLMPRQPVLLVAAVAPASLAGSASIRRTRRSVSPGHRPDPADSDLLAAIAGAELFPDRPVLVGCTGGNVHVSSGRSASPGGLVHHYGLSGHGGPLDEPTAVRLAGAIVRGRHPGGTGRLLAGPASVFHLVVTEPEQPVAVDGLP